MKNKIEAQPKKVNKKNRVDESICDVDVKHSLLNTNSEPICATCKKSMFDGVHDMRLLDFVENVNSRAESTKKHKKQNIWKPTDHVFTEVGLKWKPTSRTFTIVGNVCPLTRITLANIVPPKKTTSHSVETQKPELKVDSRKPKNVVQIVLWYLDFGCSKHMTWNRSQLMNFVSKFLGIVRFGDDNIARIMGYGDYQLGNVTISRVYYVKGLGHNLFSVGQFCDADLEVAFWKNTCFIRNLEALKTKSWLWHRHLSHLNFGTLNKLAKDGLARGIPRLKFQKDYLCSACALGKSKKSSHQPKAEDTNQEKLYLLHMDLCGLMCVANTCEFYENVDISHQTSVARTPQQIGVVKRRNRTLIEAARTMLIFSKAPLFLWAEAINTACYTQNRSLIRRRYNKTPYELMQDKKPDLSFFHVFGALCYPINDNDDLGNIDAKVDIVMACEQFSSGPGLHSMTLVTSSSGLVPNPVSQQPCIPPLRDGWDRLFQPMFDEYFNPPSIVVSPVQEADAPRAVVLADSPVSTSIDQDAPSSSTPSTQEQEQSPNISQGFKESPKTPIFHDDPLNESPHEESTSQGSSLNVRQNHTPFENLGRWTKDHPISNVIGDPSLFVSTRKQLQNNAMWFYFNAFLTSVEPKNFKQAMTEPSWIDAMQEEIHEFQRLELPNYNIPSKGAIDPTLFTRQAGNNLLRYTWETAFDAPLYRGMMVPHVSDIQSCLPLLLNKPSFDLELVPKEKRLEIGKCNGRLNPGKIQREPTFQVVLDALALTICYFAFLITTDVLEVYMHQFWDSIYKHDTFYRFKMDKRKRFKLTLEILVTLGKSIHSMMLLVDIDASSLEKRKFCCSHYRSLSGKTTGLDKLQPTDESKRVKRTWKDSLLGLARGVVIRETPEMPLSKKKDVTPLKWVAAEYGFGSVTL
ncbi:integrase, catalytic region, zinc finger, CCHC-type containing protein [Tanacetum coccineum]